MSVLLSINNYFYRRGGAEVVFLEQNRLFEEIGWTVIPFAMQHPKNLESPWENYFIEEIEFGKQYSLLKKLMLTTKITYSIEARRKIATLTLKTKPDIAHAHNIYHHISPAILSKLKSLGVPTVLTLHDLKIACPAYKMLAHDGICERCKSGALWNVALHRCIKNSITLSSIIMLKDALHRFIGIYSNNVDKFVVPSRFYLEKFVEWGWPRDRFTYIPNFVDAKQLLPKGAIGQKFVYFGRLEPEKGLTTFVKAVALAGVKAEIIGSGSEGPKLRSLAKALQADIGFQDHLTGDALFDAIRQARAVVLPSEWYENAPMSIMESYALERPVIGADIGGIPELIQPNETGALFKSGQIDSLVAQLQRFNAMSDKELLAMGQNGRQWMLSHFSAELYRERLMKLYIHLGITL